MKKRIVAVMLTVAMAASLLAGCGVPKQKNNSDSGKESTEKVFRYGTRTEPTTLDPTKANCIPDSELQNPLVERLVRNVAGEIKPGCAKEWEVSEDGLVYTFHLNENAKWSDGEQIKAQDFVYSWQRLMNPETAAQYAFIGGYIKNGNAIMEGKMNPSELAVKAIDDVTLEVTLEHPTSYFLSLIGIQPQFAPLRQDIVEKYGKDFAADASKNVYSGPFVLVSAENQKWVFEPNENYWDKENIHLDRAELSYIQNQETQLAMYENGELDFTELPKVSVQKYKDKAVQYKNGNTDYFYINCNGTNEALKNVNFRLALNYGFDRNTYNQLASEGIGAPSNVFAFRGLKGIEEGKTYGEEANLKSYPLDGDTEKAKEYLAKAEAELGKKASDISVEITTTDNDAAKKQAEVVHELWQKALGIKVTINQVTYAEMLQRQSSGEYEIGWGGWVGDYDDPYTYLELFKSDCPYNNSRYSNPKVDELLTASQNEADAKKRQELLAQAEQIILDEGAVLPQAEREVYYLIDDDVKGLKNYYVGINYDWTYVDIVK